MSNKQVFDFNNDIICNQKNIESHSDCLIKLINEFDLREIVEIGVKEGRNFEKIIQSCKNINCFSLVDPWQHYGSLGVQESSPDTGLARKTQENWNFIYEIAKKRAAKYKNTKIIKKTGVEAAKEFKDNSLDLVFIDSDHSYLSVVEESLAYLPKLKDEAIISGHDFTTGWHEVQKAVRDIYGDDFLQMPHTVWFVKLTQKRKQQYLRRIHQIKCKTI